MILFKIYNLTTLLNVNVHRYVGKVEPEQMYVGSLFRNSNVNTAKDNYCQRWSISSRNWSDVGPSEANGVNWHGCGFTSATIYHPYGTGFNQLTRTYSCMQSFERTRA